MSGRIKDIIIRGGENIAPHEVDEVLLKHPAVAAAVTFGFPIPPWAKKWPRPWCLHEPHGASESALIKHCRE